MGAGALIGAVVGGLSSGNVLGGALMHFFGDSILTGIMTGASLGSLFDQSATSSTYEFGSSQNTRSNRLPIPVIYGRCKIAGNVIYESRPDPIAIKNETLSNPSGDKTHYIFAHGEIFLNPAPVIKLYRYYYLYGGRVQRSETVIVDPSQYVINEVDGELIFYQAQVAPDPPSGYTGSGHSVTQEVRADYTYQPTTSGQIEIQVALGEGPINSVSDIKINNVAIERIANASWNIYYGSATQAADSRNPLGETFRDLAYLSISLQANDQVSGTVTVTAIVEGRIVSVWDSDAGAWIQTFSRNPVWCLLDMLTNTRYGKGIPTSKINLESFKVAAPYCDALVSDGNGGQESRFMFDYNFDAIIDSSDAIEEILKTFGGMLIRADGLIQLRVERPEVATFCFDSTNIIEGSFTYQPRQRSKEIPNRVVIEFINPNNNRNAWEMDAVVIDDEWDQEQRGKIIEKKLQYRGITRASQAGRMGWLVYDKLRWCGAICQFRVGIDSIANTVGDVVTINHVLAGGVAKKFRILSMEEAENDEATITAMLHRDDIFHDRGVVYVPVPETSLPDPFAVPDPIGLVLSESTYLNNSGEVIPEITVEFTAASQYSFYNSTLIQISDDAGITWQDVGTSTIGSYKIHGIQVGTSYQVRVKTISRSGILSAGISGNITLDGKGTPPGDVKSLTVIQQENILKVTVIPPDDPDINRFELRVGGLSWETSSYLKQFKDNQTTVDVTQAGTQTFWAKAIDNSGNYSVNAASFIAAVYPISNKFTIHEEYQSGRSWTPKCMFWDRNGWQIDSVEKLGELEYFGQMFDTDYHLCDDAEIVLNIVDLGETITSTNYVETFLSVFAEYDASDKNYLDVDYRTSWDGVNWSEWQPLVNHQFNGRFVQSKLKPRSIDGRTNVNIRGVTVRIDVTAVTETIDFVNVADTGATRIYLNHRFFNEPMPQLFSYASTGKQCTHEIVGNAIQKDVDGRWYFDIRLWDGDTQIAGKIGGAAKGY